MNTGECCSQLTQIVDGIQLADGDNHLYVKFTDSTGLIQAEYRQSGESGQWNSFVTSAYFSLSNKALKGLIPAVSVLIFQLKLRRTQPQALDLRRSHSVLERASETNQTVTYTIQSIPEDSEGSIQLSDGTRLRKARR